MRKQNNLPILRDAWDRGLVSAKIMSDYNAIIEAFATPSIEPLTPEQSNAIGFIIELYIHNLLSRQLRFFETQLDAVQTTVLEIVTHNVIYLVTECKNILSIANSKETNKYHSQTTINPYNNDGDNQPNLIKDDFITFSDLDATIKSMELMKQSNNIIKEIYDELKTLTINMYEGI